LTSKLGLPILKWSINPDQEDQMQIPVSEAKASLTELLHRAEAGEEIILTRRGRSVARIVPVERELTYEQRRALIEKVRSMAPPLTVEDLPAERSRDFLYGEDGLPE
jgi:prevent-host-death family protein